MDRTTIGWINGFAGVLIFSGSLPATRVAVAGFDPLFLTLARASIAGMLAAILLLALRQKRPGSDDLLPLAIVSLGVVVGFPLLTAFALQRITQLPNCGRRNAPQPRRSQEHFREMHLVQGIRVREHGRDVFGFRTTIENSLEI